MATKRKRESDEESWTSPPLKLIKEEDVKRSGRVRKKPSKFIEHEPETDLTVKIKAEPELIPVSVPISVQEMLATNVEPEPIQEEFFTPMKIDTSFSADEDFGKSDDTGKSGGRSGRARKKSAKVLEMEEFEEAERKSLKKDVGKKTATPVQGLPKKVPKSPPSPVSAVASPPPIPTMKLKTTVLPTMNSPPASQMSSPKKNTSPKSPIASQGEGKASVIKLLLSSPAQSTSSLISAASVSQISPPAAKPVTGSTKKKGKNKEKNAQEFVVTSPVSEKGPLKQVIHIAKQPSMIKQETDIQEDMSVNALLQMDQKNISIKEEKPKTPKEPKIKKEKKSPKDTQVLGPPPPLPSPNVIHVGALSMGGMDIKPELEVVSSKKKKQPKVVIEREEEAVIKDEYELDVPDIELGEPGEDSFMKMEDSSLEIHDEFKVKPKAVKKKKAAKDKSDKLAVPDSMDMPSSDLVMDFSRMKNTDKKKKKVVEEDEKAMKRKRAPTAYTLWCGSIRPKVVAENPGIDFSTISKTLGEMWSTLSEKEKMLWKRKAKKAAGKGSTLITTGKGAIPKAPVPQIVPTSKPGKEMLPKVAMVQSTSTATKTQKVVVDDVSVPLRGFGTEPVDVAAHLKIVGESLSIIGMKLQEHRGLIAVQGSLSVLLDSMLCAVAPLMCLTSILPETDGLPEQVHLKNLDNIAYIMPGL